MPQEPPKPRQKPVLLFFCDRAVPGAELSYEAELLDISSTTHGTMDLDAVTSGVLADLQRVLDRHTRDGRDIFLHISTHGAEDGLSVQTKSWLVGSTEPAKAAANDLLVLTPKSVRGIVLAACDSSAFVKDGSAFKGIPYLVTMNDKVYDADARAYSRSFYSCLVSDHRDSLEADLRAWANTVSNGCTVHLGASSELDLIQRTLLKEAGPLPQVTCSIDNWITTGAVTFTSTVPLVRDDETATEVERTVSPGTKIEVHEPPFFSFGPTRRRVRALTSLPLRANSKQQIHIINRWHAGIIVALSVAATFGMAVEMWRARFTPPLLSATNNTQVPAIIAFVGAILGSIGGISLLREFADKHVTRTAYFALLAIVLFLLANHAFGHSLTNLTREHLPAPGWPYAPDASMLVAKDWDAGTIYEVTSNSVACRTRWDVGAYKGISDAGIVELDASHGCPRPGNEPHELVNLAALLGADGGVKYEANVRPNYDFAPSGFVDRKALDALKADWHTSLQIVRPPVALTIVPKERALGSEVRIDVAPSQTEVGVLLPLASVRGALGARNAQWDSFQSAEAYNEIVSTNPCRLHLFELTKGYTLLREGKSLPVVATETKSYVAACETPKAFTVSVAKNGVQTVPAGLAAFGFSAKFGRSAEVSCRPLDKRDMLVGLVEPRCAYSGSVEVDGRRLACWEDGAPCPQSKPTIRCECGTGKHRNAPCQESAPNKKSCPEAGPECQEICYN